jgi:hypothetical protein
MNAARAIDAYALRLAHANLLVAEAELARLEGRPWAAVAADLQAFAHAPSARRGRAVMADLRRLAAMSRHLARL